MNLIHTFLAVALLVNTALYGQVFRLSDTKASAEAVRLYASLNRIRQKGYLVGHQDALAYGVKWKYQAGRSDIKEVVGDYPALYGWELGHIEKGSALNLDSVPFDKMKNYIRQGYERGGVITISWHGDNPLTGKSAWDAVPGSVAAVLPGGEKHEVFVQQLDKVAAFLADLKGKNGKAIPVLFRPFHELTGNWFWWGAKNCSPEEFKTLFRFTVDYFRHKKALNHLIIVYNTAAELKSKEEFLERYPGDDYVDMISFDTYQYGKPESGPAFIKNFEFHLILMEQISRERNKIPAVGEIGYNLIPSAQWFSKVVQPAMKKYHMAYLLFWRNAGYKVQDKAMEFYAPYTGHPAAADFRKFYNLKETFFEKDAAAFKLYQ